MPLDMPSQLFFAITIVAIIMLVLLAVGTVRVRAVDTGKLRRVVTIPGALAVILIIAMFAMMFRMISGAR